MIVIYGTDACPYCDNAKALAIANELPYIFIPVGDDLTQYAVTKAELQRLCPTETPVTTVPQIFNHVPTKGMTYIGTFDAFDKYLREHPHGK